MSVTLESAKANLRIKFAKIIKGIDMMERKRQSQVVFQKLTSLPQYKESKRISIYLSTPEEVDTVPILKDILEKGKEAFVPRYYKNKMEMVKIYSMEDYEKLPLTKWNIKQPKMDEIRDNALETGLDLMILPGVAFTKDGKRLGHGKAYYDIFIESYALQRKQMPYLMAIAFNEQIEEDLPTNEQDNLLSLVLTEKYN